MEIEFISNKTNKKRGKCMKRLLTITMTVLLAALLIVSCNVETGNIEDSLALITFSAGERETRSLTRTNPQLDPDDFYWYYTATKTDSTGLVTGVETKQKAVNEGKKGLDEVGPFSYGEWSFTLYGYAGEVPVFNADGTLQSGNLAYTGNNPATISSKETTIAITVASKQEKEGYLAFPKKGDIALTGEDISSVNYSELMEVLTIKRVDATADDIVHYDYATTNDSGLRQITLNSGSYSVTFSYRQNAALNSEKTALTAEDITVAEETIYVAIADYLTTTIGGDIASNTGSVEFIVDSGVTEIVIKEVAVKTTENTVFQASSADSGSSSEGATTSGFEFTVPAGGLTGKKAEMKAEVYSQEVAASKGASYLFTDSSDVVVGGFDASIFVDGSTEKTKEFVKTTTNEDGTVTKTIEKSVAKLTLARNMNGGKFYLDNSYSGVTKDENKTYSDTCDINSKYSGDTSKYTTDNGYSSDAANGKILYYNPETGETHFQVEHLSTYYFASSSAVVFDAKNNTVYSSLSDAVEKAPEGSELKLLVAPETITSTIPVEKSLTLDLSGKTVNSDVRVFLVSKGTLTIKNGEIKANISANNSSAIKVDSAKGNAGVVLAKDAKVTAENSYGITAFGTSNNATIDVYGTIESANPCIAGQGASAYFGCNVTMNVYDGAVLSQDGTEKSTSWASDKDLAAVYQPNPGTLNIYGGTITSKDGSAVEIRAGKANISGGTFKSEAAYECTANASGPTVKGAAVAVSQHSTKKDIDVTISGGTFTASGTNGKQLAVVDTLSESTIENQKLVKVVVSVSDISSANTIGFVNNGTYYVNRAAAEVNDGKITKSVWSGSVISDGSGLSNDWFEKVPKNYYDYNAETDTTYRKTFQNWFKTAFFDTGKASYEERKLNDESTENDEFVLTVYDADLFASTDLINKYLTLLIFDKSNWNRIKAWTILVDVDLDLGSNEWNPITLCSYGYQIYDFNGHTISNLKISSVSSGNIGLFSTSAGEIKNLTIENADISASNQNSVGILIGKTESSSKISNVKVKDSKVLGYKYVGGITGYFYAATGSISKCSIDHVTVEAEFEQVGGIVGYVTTGNITECTVMNSEISATIGKGTESANNVGGIAGRAYACAGGENDITVTKNSVSNTKVSAGDKSASGAIGYGGNNYCGYICGGEYINKGEVNISEYTDTPCKGGAYETIQFNTWSTT